MSDKPKVTPKETALGGLLLLGLIFSLTACSGSGSSNDSSLHPEEAPSQASASDQIASWRDSGGLLHINTLSGDFESIGSAGADVGALHDACQSLQVDVESAQAFDPIPDTLAQSSWSSALAMYARASADCLAATTRGDADLALQAAEEMNEGESRLNDASARIRDVALGGS